MSRAALTNQEVLSLAETVDWWIPPGPGPHAPISLKDAVKKVCDQSGGTLFRPGGGGQPALWLQVDEVQRAARVLGIV